MSKLLIPRPPDSLYFVINRFWNGEACGDELYHAEVWLQATGKGLNIRCHCPTLPNQRIPNAPRDKRFDGLWEYDVVEVFLVGADGKYLEVELGAGGHWLVLGFDGIRHRSNDYVDFNPDHRNGSAVEDTWQSNITIPWEMVPTSLVKMNAYAIFGGQFLAMNPVPGAEPNFHQPDTFPDVEVAEI